jgi:hypothetical protein
VLVEIIVDRHPIEIGRHPRLVLVEPVGILADLRGNRAQRLGELVIGDEAAAREDQRVMRFGLAVDQREIEALGSACMS